MDMDKLWDFNDPKISEQRFEEAATNASKNDQLLLQTQIARTYGIRKDFAKTRELLAAIEPELEQSSAELRVRYHLELGRSYASTAHIKSDRTPENLEAARQNYLKAFELASAAKLDFLAIDALHMMPMVDTSPEDQLKWNQKALTYLEQSNQPDAKGWEGPLRNNVGYALHLQGEYEQALKQFQQSRDAYERGEKLRNVKIADWMIAWTLRAQEKYQEALEIQLKLEQQWDELGEPDPYVYQELESLYRALENESMAEAYRVKYEAETR